MSKDIVIYYSKNNTTKETVDEIEKVSKSKTDIFDLKDSFKNDLNSYDRVFIGGGVYAGNFQRKVVDFVKKNSGVLKSKRVIFFVHGMASDSNYKEVVGRAMNGYLPSNCYDIFYLGGKLDINKQNFFIKMLLLNIAKKNNSDPYITSTIKKEKVSEFLKCFTQ